MEGRLKLNFKMFKFIRSMSKLDTFPEVKFTNNVGKIIEDLGKGKIWTRKERPFNVNRRGMKRMNNQLKLLQMELLIMASSKMIKNHKAYRLSF